MQSPKWRTAAITLGLVAFWTAGLGLWYGRPIQRWAESFARNREYRNSPDRLPRELASGDVRAGTPIEQVLAIHSPQIVERHGRFTSAYFNLQGVPEDIKLIARDGRLVLARHSHTATGHVLFSTMNYRDGHDYYESLSAFLDAQMADPPGR